MASEKQVRANRRNAQKSTGPKTPEGKAAVRLNAAKHGLLSKETLLPGEDEAALEELAERLRAELRPAGELEALLVERIVAAHWRLSRLGRVEAGVFAYELHEELAERSRWEASEHRVDALVERLTGGYGAAFGTAGQEEHREALSGVEETKSRQDAETATVGRAFIRDANGANAFSKLSRYETAIERGLYRALHELQRLQAARRAEGGVPPPAAVDVDVSGLPGEGS